MSAETLSASTAFDERLPSMVGAAKIEVIPSDKILGKVDLIPKTSVLSVTASPTKEIEETIELSDKLIDKGYKVIPHIAARRIRNHDQLVKISNFLDSRNVEEIFVVGGDKEPFGEYTYSAKLLEDLLDINHSVKSVGVTGYPEGHKKITEPDLLRHLKAKIDIARNHNIEIHINSQACINAHSIDSWISRHHAENVDLPIFLGTSPPINKLKLAQIFREIDLSDIAAYLEMVGVGSAVESVLYNPMDTLSGLAKFPSSDSIKGIHLFTFNFIKSSVEWQKNFKV